ncbi:hypothetical protein SMITH_462 [Smithella sp. ME-1]|uniref:Uncharacterized protein n=1 Tax=hydrocarbon metagenome TaxID=938273 RepID=A0A0W8FMB9_9ZZZZ|nr:hypothetical protein SMITH_462 [Smithella sp. ME-1]
MLKLLKPRFLVSSLLEMTRKVFVTKLFRQNEKFNLQRTSFMKFHYTTSIVEVGLLVML